MNSYYSIQSATTLFQTQTLRFQVCNFLQWQSNYIYKKSEMLENQRLVLNTIDAVHFIRLKDILYCKSENSYTTFHFINSEPIVVSKNIKEFENQLNKSCFFRSHQSYLVNLEHITKIDKQNGFTLLLTDKSQIPTSTRKRKGLLQILQKEQRFQID